MGGNVLPPTNTPTQGGNVDAAVKRQIAEERAMRQGRGRNADRGHIVSRAKTLIGGVERISGNRHPLIVWVKPGTENARLFKRFCERNGVSVQWDQRGWPVPIQNRGEDEVVFYSTTVKTFVIRVGNRKVIAAIPDWVEVSLPDGPRPIPYEVVATEATLELLIDSHFVAEFQFVHSHRGHRFHAGPNRDRTTRVVQTPTGSLPKDASAGVRRELARRALSADQRRHADATEFDGPKRAEVVRTPWYLVRGATFARFDELVQEYKRKNRVPEGRELDDKTLLAIASDMTGIPARELCL